MPTSALIFDFFGVVAQYDDAPLYQKLLQHCPDPEGARAWLDAFASMPELITGRFSLSEVHAALCGGMGLTLPLDAFTEVWRGPYSSPMPGMARLLEELAPDHPLFVLSNIDADYWQAITPLHPELSLFSNLILSFEQGICKPDPRAFENACRLAGASPGECFFTDDKPAFVEAARRCGLDAHLFAGVDGLMAALRARAVLRD